MGSRGRLCQDQQSLLGIYLDLQLAGALKNQRKQSEERHSEVFLFSLRRGHHCSVAQSLIEDGEEMGHNICKRSTIEACSTTSFKYHQKHAQVHMWSLCSFEQEIQEFFEKSDCILSLFTPEVIRIKHSFDYLKKVHLFTEHISDVSCVWRSLKVHRDDQCDEHDHWLITKQVHWWRLCEPYKNSCTCRRQLQPLNRS